MFKDPCEFCGCGTWGFDGKPRGGCMTSDCPGNPEVTVTEDPRLMKAVRDAVVAEACRRRGIPKPQACGEFVRISDLYPFVRAALEAVRKFDPQPPAGADREQG